MSVPTWIETALAATRSTELVVIVTETTQANLRWANNALTTNGQMHSLEATVIAFDIAESDSATAVASGPIATKEALLALVSRVDEDLRGAAREELSSLPPGSVDQSFTEPHPADQGGIGVLAAMASALGEAFATAPDTLRFFGFAEHILTTTWLGTSTGTRRRRVQPLGKFELNAKDAATGGSAWVGQATRDFSDVDTSALVTEALEQLSWAKTRIDLPAGRYETLLPPGAVADLLIYAFWTMSGQDADEGRNVFSGPNPGTNRIGEQLAVLPITMSSDPAYPGLEVADFAIIPASESGMLSVWDNGADAARVDWLRYGTLERLVRTRAGHAKSGETTPWCFPSQNLIADTGSRTSLADMIATTKKGLLLTCLWYIREVDPETLLLTGLTRDGVYLVEDGKVVGAVNNFRFNESPIDLLRRATEASVATPTLCREWNDWFTLTVMPALRIPDFNMSTVSQAT